MDSSESISARHEALGEHLNERDRRLLAASEAKTAGWGGIVAVSRATGVARSTIGRGLKDLAAPEGLAPGRIRRPGGENYGDGVDGAPSGIGCAKMAIVVTIPSTGKPS